MRRIHSHARPYRLDRSRQHCSPYTRDHAESTNTISLEFAIGAAIIGTALYPASLSTCCFVSQSLPRLDSGSPARIENPCIGSAVHSFDGQTGVSSRPLPRSRARKFRSAAKRWPGYSCCGFVTRHDNPAATPLARLTQSSSLVSERLPRCGQAGLLLQPISKSCGIDPRHAKPGDAHFAYQSLHRVHVRAATDHCTDVSDSVANASNSSVATTASYAQRGELSRSRGRVAGHVLCSVPRRTGRWEVQRP